MGFFSEAGPLQVFVSNHLIPEGFEFNTAHEPCYQTTDGDQKIVPGSEVRLRIVGTRVDASDIVSGAGGRFSQPRPAVAASQPACLPAYL
jgi:DNA-directed RNA polymerase II subunit RPB7